MPVEKRHPGSLFLLQVKSWIRACAGMTNLLSYPRQTSTLGKRYYVTATGRRSTPSNAADTYADNSAAPRSDLSSARYSEKFSPKVSIQAQAAEPLPFRRLATVAERQEKSQCPRRKS